MGQRHCARIADLERSDSDLSNSSQTSWDRGLVRSQMAFFYQLRSNTSTHSLLHDMPTFSSAPSSASSPLGGVRKLALTMQGDPARAMDREIDLRRVDHGRGDG